MAGSEFDLDYPAAHSMDTTWFAVDQDGYVALMDSSEPGAVPMAYGGDQGNGMEFLETLAKHTGRQVELDKYECPNPESVGLYGFYCDYDHPSVIRPDGSIVEDLYADEDLDAVPPYKRVNVPSKPLHVSELPASLQHEVKNLVFKDLSFKDCEWIQPGLKLPCQFWAQEDQPLSAVDADGRIVEVPPEMRPKWSDRDLYYEGKPSKPKQEDSSALPWWKKLFRGF